MSGNDLRGFYYPLEPAWRRAAQHYERALGVLGSKLKALEDGRAPMQALAARCTELARRLTPAAASVVDPVRAAQGSLHLGHLHRLLWAARAEVRGLEGAVEEAKLDVAKLRGALEAFNTHREAALGEHGRSLGRRAQIEADQDWLSRKHSGVAPSTLDQAQLNEDGRR